MLARFSPDGGELGFPNKREVVLCLLKPFDLFPEVNEINDDCRLSALPRELGDADADEAGCGASMSMRLWTGTCGVGSLRSAAS